MLRALAEGRLHQARYDSFLKLRRELAYEEARTNGRAARARTRSGASTASTTNSTASRGRAAGPEKCRRRALIRIHAAGGKEDRNRGRGSACGLAYTQELAQDLLAHFARRKLPYPSRILGLDGWI